MSDPEHISADLAASLESLHRTIQSRQREEAQEPQKSVPAKVVQLPLWPEGRRAAPNAVFRSALFPALKFKEGRPFLEEQSIPAVAGIEVSFTGQRFDQSDLDVYLELLDLARSHPLGTECSFSAHGLLKRLHRATGYSDHKWLHSVLIRLRGSTVEISDHKMSYFGGLIEGGFKDKLDRQYRVTINPKFAALFGYAMWSSINREQRYVLGRNATAKALHAYYSTHAAPGAHLFETLARIVGLEEKRERDRRRRLIDAHKVLASPDVNFLREYSVSKDGRTIKVHIHPTATQAQHIVRKAVKRRLRRPHQAAE
jgi:TrfA protein